MIEAVGLGASDSLHSTLLLLASPFRALTVHIHPTVSELIPTRAISSHWKPD